MNLASRTPVGYALAAGILAGGISALGAVRDDAHSDTFLPIEAVLTTALIY